VKVIGAVVAIVGLAILFSLGLGLWNTSPPAFVGISMGQTLVGVATITATGLAIGLLPRRSTTDRASDAVAAVRPVMAVQWVLSVIGFVAVIVVLAIAAYTISMSNTPSVSIGA
jgi:hypothetical protein